MKKINIIFIITVFLMSIVFIRCSEDNPGNSIYDPGLPRSLSKSEIELIASDNIFGLKLFKEIVTTEGDKNIFISPLSVALALGMTYNGARGTTQEAMQSALELNGMNLEEVNEAYKNLMVLLLNLESRVQLEIANSIWYREGFEVEQDFIDLNKNYYDAVVASLDFASPDALETINNWCSSKTHGKVNEVIDSIDPLTMMFLINAIYFKGTWTYQFDKKDTKDDVFTTAAGTQVDCKMMSQENDFHYAAFEDFQMIDLPYGKGNFTMTIFLPKDGTSVDDVIGQFTAENWNTWVESLGEFNGTLYMPKFKLEYKLKMNDVLSALGMGIAFDPARADFTGIYTPGELFISRVLHKTFVDVYEEGTEAAAVTVVEMQLTSIGGGFTMRVDKPFVFAIREVNSGTILFIGKIVEPVLN